MISNAHHSNELFSFHLLNLPLAGLPFFLLRPAHRQHVPGLLHSESFFSMRLGAPIMALNRYNLRTVALFAWWREESFLEDFLARPTQQCFKDGWHVRMKLYRRWGEVTELKDAMVDSSIAKPDLPVVAVTLARLKLTETVRFIKWGRPVESQVREHKGQLLAMAAVRPLNTFSTFSVWRNESEMLSMVNGGNRLQGGEEHLVAMRERVRRDFHHEFTTMRFVPTKEVGVWNGQSWIDFDDES